MPEVKVTAAETIAEPSPAMDMSKAEIWVCRFMARWDVEKSVSQSGNFKDD
jgi:hypothetical protein